MTEILQEDQRFEISPATLDDVVGIGEAHLQSWIETYPNEELGITEEWIKNEFGFLIQDGQREDGTDNGVAFRRKLLQKPSPDRLYEVVKDEDGKVQGFLHATRKAEGATLDAIYLTAGLLGKGVAQEFMAHALDFIGDKPIELEAAAYNERAIRFYEKYGFVRGDMDPELFHGKVPILHMKREIR